MVLKHYGSKTVTKYTHKVIILTYRDLLLLFKERDLRLSVDLDLRPLDRDLRPLSADRSRLLYLSSDLLLDLDLCLCFRFDFLCLLLLYLVSLLLADLHQYKIYIHKEEFICATSHGTDTIKSPNY